MRLETWKNYFPIRAGFLLGWYWQWGNFTVDIWRENGEEEGDDEGVEIEKESFPSDGEEIGGGGGEEKEGKQISRVEWEHIIQTHTGLS